MLEGILIKSRDHQSSPLRIARAPWAVTKHIVHFDLIPRAMSTGGDGPHVIAIKERLARVDAHAGDSHSEVISEA